MGLEDFSAPLLRGYGGPSFWRQAGDCSPGGGGAGLPPEWVQRAVCLYAALILGAGPISGPGPALGRDLCAAPARGRQLPFMYQLSSLSPRRCSRALGPQTSGPGRGISAGLDPPHRCRLARWQRDGSHLPSGAGVSQHHLGPAKPVSLFLGFSASSPGAAAAAARRCGDLSLSLSSLFSSTLQVSHFLDSVSS